MTATTAEMPGYVAGRWTIDPVHSDVNGFGPDPFAADPFAADPLAGARAGFSATGEINRIDFGVSYNGPIPGGGVALSEKVQIVLEIEAALQPTATSAS